jgi:hypothetical protein
MQRRLVLELTQSSSDFEALNGIRIYGVNMWNETRTLDALRKLQAVRLGDGSVDVLVNQAADGLWSTNGTLNQRQKRQEWPR